MVIIFDTAQCDSRSKVAKKAQAENITLKQSVVALGLLTEEQFDQYVKPEEMCSPNRD
jgi:fumarate hydratase class II